MFADDVQIGRLGGTNVRNTKFAERGLVLHPNPLWSRGELHAGGPRADGGSAPELRPQNSTRAFLCGGEDGALRFPGVGHPMDAPTRLLVVF